MARTPLDYYGMKHGLYVKAHKVDDMVEDFCNGTQSKLKYEEIYNYNNFMNRKSVPKIDDKIPVIDQSGVRISITSYKAKYCEGNDNNLFNENFTDKLYYPFENQTFTLKEFCNGNNPILERRGSAYLMTYKLLKKRYCNTLERLLSGSRIILKSYDEDTHKLIYIYWNSLGINQVATYTPAIITCFCAGPGGKSYGSGGTNSSTKSAEVCSGGTGTSIVFQLNLVEFFCRNNPNNDNKIYFFVDPSNIDNSTQNICFHRTGHNDSIIQLIGGHGGTSYGDNNIYQPYDFLSRSTWFYIDILGLTGSLMNLHKDYTKYLNILRIVDGSRPIYNHSYKYQSYQSEWNLYCECFNATAPYQHVNSNGNYVLGNHSYLAPGTILKKEDGQTSGIVINGVTYSNGTILTSGITTSGYTYNTANFVYASGSFIHYGDTSKWYSVNGEIPLSVVNANTLNDNFSKAIQSYNLPAQFEYGERYPVQIVAFGTNNYHIATRYCWNGTISVSPGSVSDFGYGDSGHSIQNGVTDTFGPAGVVIACGSL